MSLPATLSPLLAERLASQARAVQRARSMAPTVDHLARLHERYAGLARAAATHRKIIELQPRFGWPSAIHFGPIIVPIPERKA